jgi:DNA-binding transcriptional LysR family regulator
LVDSMAVTLRQLEVFVAVADHGGFSAAAAALGLGQPSVSHSLASLEKLVRGELVRRSPPVRTTELGEALLPHARATLAAARTFDAAARARAGASVPTSISLSVPPTVARGLLPGLLRLWHEHAPRIDVTIFEAIDDEIEQWLEAGTTDAAFLIDPDPIPEGGVHVATDTYQAVVRSDHPLAAEPSVALAELLEDPLLVTTSGFPRDLRRLHDLARLPYRPDRHVRELTTLLTMVEAGLGVSILPSLAAPMLGDTLTLVPLRPRLERRIVLTGPTHRPWHPAATTLTHLTSEHTRRAPSATAPTPAL